MTKEIVALLFILLYLVCSLLIFAAIVYGAWQILFGGLLG